jgi:hypothetical protein
MGPGFRRDAGFLYEVGGMSRRVWLIALCLYGAAAAVDFGVHLNADSRAGQDWRDPANLAVAFSAGLFWPADLIAALLLPR